MRALGREVRVVLEGVDKHSNLFGTLMYPQGDVAVDLGEQLVSNGYAKVRAQPVFALFLSSPAG